MPANTDRVIAEVAVEPVVGEDRHRDLVDTAIAALDDPALEVRPGPMSTVLSGPLDDVLHAVNRAHAAVAGEAHRVVTTVRLESRREGVDLGEREADTPS